MNREELARLLALTHPTIRTDVDSACANPSTGRGYQHIPSMTSSPLSPRQQFQSRIRTLSEDNVLLQSPSQPTQRSSYELQHVSSLRVQRPSLSPLQARNAAASRYSDSMVQSLRQVTEEPEFVVEEREAWSTQLPDQPELQGEEEDNNEEETYILEESPQQSPLPASQKLTAFGPQQFSLDIEERPKTSRGLSSESFDFGFKASRVSTSDMRRSRFIEGSMNDRSVAIASSWTPLTNVDENARPSMESRASGLSDIADFQPQSQPSATLRQRLFRKTNVPKSSEEYNRAIPVLEKKKKGLRKAISTWNFHGLGGKMKMFNGTCIEPETKPAEPNKEQLAILDDRKRKAEEAYTEQFRLKKQKSNSGIAVSEDKPSQASMRRRSVLTLRESESVKSRHSRRISSTGSVPATGSSRLSDSEGEPQRKLSRTDLEKENRQLRALLRDHEKQLADASSAKSEPLLFPVFAIPGPTTTQKNSSPEKQARSRSENVPPLPAIPTKFGLANGNSNRISVSSDSTKPSKGLPRPVSMILEVDEDDENRQPESNQAKRSRIGDHEKWEWPEDVF